MEGLTNDELDRIVMALGISKDNNISWEMVGFPLYTKLIKKDCLYEDHPTNKLLKVIDAYAKSKNVIKEVHLTDDEKTVLRYLFRYGSSMPMADETEELIKKLFDAGYLEDDDMDEWWTRFYSPTEELYQLLGMKPPK